MGETAERSGMAIGTTCQHLEPTFVDEGGHVNRVDQPVRCRDKKSNPVALRQRYKTKHFSGATKMPSTSTDTSSFHVSCQGKDSNNSHKQLEAHRGADLMSAGSA